jgi:hypothetical protein
MARPEITGRKIAPAFSSSPIAGPQATGLSADILRGAAEIARFLWDDDSRAAQRRLYHEQGRWPIFRLEDDGVFYALKSRLRAHLEAKSAEKEAQIAAAAIAAETKAARPRHRRTRKNTAAAAIPMKEEPGAARIKHQRRLEQAKASPKIEEDSSLA